MMMRHSNPFGISSPSLSLPECVPVLPPALRFLVSLRVLLVQALGLRILLRLLLPLLELVSQLSPLRVQLPFPDLGGLPGLEHRVVGLPRSLVGQDLVSIGESVELLCSLRVVRVLVRMASQSLFPVCLLYRLLCRVGLHVEQKVQVEILDALHNLGRVRLCRRHRGGVRGSDLTLLGGNVSSSSIRSFAVVCF